jgi:pimeloyl-ACP methyl ester carboxylesterase
MWAVHLALSLMALYAAIIAGMYFAQTWLLFPTALARIARVQTPASTQRLEVQTPDGESLIGVRIRGTASGRPTLLGFGGNAWNAEATALTLHNLLPDHDVVAFHYRGYAPSSGRPSAQALLSDSLVVFDCLRQALAHERIVFVGFSIGSGVAAYLARHRPAAGLILVTPFDSLETLARDLYWWAPVGLLLRHRMPTIEFVRGSVAPTALILAAHDAVVPARRSAPLRPAIKNLVFERTIDAGHNDIYDRPAFAEAIREAVARIEALSDSDDNSSRDSAARTAW